MQFNIIPRIPLFWVGHNLLQWILTEFDRLFPSSSKFNIKSQRIRIYYLFLSCNKPFSICVSVTNILSSAFTFCRLASLILNLSLFFLLFCCFFVFVFFLFCFCFFVFFFFYSFSLIWFFFLSFSGCCNLRFNLRPGSSQYRSPGRHCMASSFHQQL